MEINIPDEYQSITLLNEMVNMNDDSTAILVDGQYYIPVDTKTALYPENESQYFINNTADMLFDNTDDNAVFDNNEAFHLINNTHNEDILDQNQLVYFTNDMLKMEEISEDADISHKSELSVANGIEPSIEDNNEIKGEFFDLNSFLDLSGGNEMVDNETNGFQYIVQLQNFDSLQNIQDCKMENILEHAYSASINSVEQPTVPIDISKITGKNLLTGQTVTLESYLEKVKNSSKELTLQNAEDISKSAKKKNEPTALSNLLNKKLTIGKTLNGQRLIGKVIHVGKKDDDIEDEPIVLETQCIGNQDIGVSVETCTDLSAAYYDTEESHVPNSVIIKDNQNQDANILLENINDMFISLEAEDISETIKLEDPTFGQEGTILNDNDQTMLDYVSKTMANLMNMESVLKKLKRKNLLIKVTEKIIKDDQKKVNTFQFRGHLEMLGGWRRHEYQEKWIFKLDAEKAPDEIGEWNELGTQKFHETIKLTITVVKVDGLIQSTKVNLNYNVEKCSMCSKEFRSIYKLKTHLKLTHNVDYQYRCQICDRSLENKEVYDQHRKYHVNVGQLFPCDECDKHFLSSQKLTKHLLTHNIDIIKLTCTVCGEAFDKITCWKEHMLKHDETSKFNKTLHGKRYTNNDMNSHSKDVKNCYVCKVCNRTFSRYSNLQRHSEIHGTKNSLAVYSCSMCGCTYNYISSLTRHIVQNHISAT